MREHGDEHAPRRRRATEEDAMSDEQSTTLRFPHTEIFTVEGEHFTADEVLEALGETLSSERRQAIDQVVEGRTFEVTVVCEDLYDLGNVAAVMRSAEALGFASMHVIKRQERFKTSARITTGVDKWLDLRTWDDTARCVEELKARGYRVVATHLGERARPLDEFDFTQPTAVVFGNEHAGVTDELIELADATCVIPMAGFAQSLNISVAAALLCYHVVKDRERRQGHHGDLNDEEKRILRASYYLRGHKTGEKYMLGWRARNPAAATSSP
ncbi:MAG: RNA methyltransferase [Myxococcota bacterium]